MMMTEVQNQRGVTLIEMMIAIGAACIISMAIFAAMRISIEAFESNNLRMTIQTSAREGLYRMVQEIRETSPSRYAVADGGSSITFTVPNGASPVTDAYAVNWGDQIQYALGTDANAGRIIRTNLTTSDETVMASDVTGLTFTAGGSTITVEMNVQRDLINGRSVPETPLEMTAQARLRNTG